MISGNPKIFQSSTPQESSTVQHLIRTESLPIAAVDHGQNAMFFLALRIDDPCELKW